MYLPRIPGSNQNLFYYHKIFLFQSGLLDSKPDLELGVHYDAEEVQYETEEIQYESEVHVEDVHLTDPSNVYLNVGLESESEHSEVLSLPSTSEDGVLPVREL